MTYSAGVRISVAALALFLGTLGLPACGPGSGQSDTGTAGGTGGESSGSGGESGGSVGSGGGGGHGGEAGAAAAGAGGAPATGGSPGIAGAGGAAGAAGGGGATSTGGAAGAGGVPATGGASGTGGGAGALGAAGAGGTAGATSGGHGGAAGAAGGGGAGVAGSAGHGGAPATGGASGTGGAGGAAGAGGAGGHAGAAAGAGGVGGHGGAAGAGGVGGQGATAGAGGHAAGGAAGAGGAGGVGGAAGSCCGCLCGDPSWSCSADTCLDSGGHAIGLGFEAGFFQLPGGSYVAESQPRVSPTHRIWYSFQPATTSPQTKPLAVFFNGGPGSATSSYLFSFNTAPWTLDPAVAGSQPLVADPTSWAAFANLLYIDAPGCGFSYPLPLDDGTQPSVGIDLDRDAADVIRVVVRFLDRHLALQSNPVIIVGESYGGTRATLMLDRLLNYQELATAGAVYQDAGLEADLLAHFAAVYAGTNPAKVSPAQIATQFGHQVLIQPVVTGSSQWNINAADTSVCVSSFEPYECDQANGWYNQMLGTASNNLLTLATFKQALGVDATTIAWMHASARTKAYGRSPGNGFAAPDLVAAFGTLDANDTYFMALNGAVLAGYSNTSRWWTDPSIGISFLGDVAYVDTFITDARLDMVVWSPSIPPSLLDYPTIVSGVNVDMTPRTGVARAGWIEVAYQPGVAPGSSAREIRFPYYASAGHSVSMKEPAQLLADVMAWYQQTAAAPVQAFASAATGSTLRPSPTPVPSTPQPRPFVGP